MSTAMGFVGHFTEDLTQIKNIMSSNLKDKNVNVQLLISNLAVVEGKMIRAIFVLIGASFGKGQKNNLLQICAAVEILHLATLVHDDIIDDSNLRRGKSTINATNGIKSALFMGDYLFSESYILFSKSASKESITNISETIKLICKSEIDQFVSAYSLNSSIKDYLRRINGKCASLFSLSLSIGAFEGAADKKIVLNLKRIGYYCGMAFQLIDDILDITTEKFTLGKPSETDIKKGIYSLPILIEIKNKNIALLNALQLSDQSKVLEIVKTSSSLQKSKEVARKYTNKALKLIDQLPDSSQRLILKSIVETLVIRTY